MARSLSDRIRSQEFAFQPYIPSIPQLMQEYDASLATIRSAVALLNDIGLIQTAPKKGSIILRRQTQPQTMKLEIALVRENIVYFLDALQLLALCWSPLAKTVYPSLSKAECEQYAQRLTDLGLTSDSLLSELLWQLGEKVVYPGQRSLLEQLKNLLIWGYYLKRLPPDADYPDLTQPERIAAILNQLIQALNRQQTDLFIELSQVLFFQAYALARSLVLHCGAQESELPAAFPASALADLNCQSKE
ncbi:GntR family transcriptional regulator [Holdemania massiliensis]|uniref:GntR family transcriptional regulator n=1 Tax=Holdemania massiliensis TaxID=1468449 RepID=UPI0031F4B52C